MFPSLPRTLLSHRRSRSVLFALTITVTSFGLAGCRSVSAQKNSGEAAHAPLVEVVEVAPTTAELLAEYPAQTYARNMVEVRGRVDGYVDKWLFRPGQFVKQGQALYVLDLRPYQAQVQQAQGALRQSEADLTFARQQVSLLEAEANLASAEANLVKARQDYERLQPLVQQDAAAQQDLDAAVANLRAAEASVRAHKANVEQTRLTTGTQIQSTEGKVEAQRGALETASLNLQYATIRAPISGIVGDSVVPVGGLVTANSPQPLTTIVPLDTIWVRFKVSESEHLALTRRYTGSKDEGPALRMILADNTEFPHIGRIRNALNQVDPKTGTLELQAEFPNPGHTLLPGQFGRIQYIAERREQVLVIPQRAVQQNQNLQLAYIVGPGNKVEARSIKTGQRVGDSLLVEEGLKAGDRVIVEGLMTIRPGATVTPKPWTAKSSAALPGKVG
ncbi:MAG: efflux RND transporter periplasmic adaptor subunit [Bryobacteraceae bacterium]|nr:efflux RND transporter periplasmic adaptor subunit [Bryobacteraceae bacterium]